MVWVDSRWVHEGDSWLETRATAPGLLDDLPVEWGTPGEDDVRHPGIFSLVVDDATAKTRKLPSLYHGNAQIYAHRDVDEVRARLVGTIRTVLAADVTPSYLVTACRAGDHYGLWARDVFNRDAFRMRAARAGLVLADEPHTRMTDDGRFEADGWDPFDPEFVVVQTVRSPDGSRNVNRGAFLTFLFGILRVGDMAAVELHHLVRTIKTARVVTGEDPVELVENLRAG